MMKPEQIHLDQHPQVRYESCDCVQAAFSDYLDSSISGREMQAISAHLQGCDGCSSDFAAWRTLQQTLIAMPSPRAPKDLGLKLRVALSREHARSRSASWTGWVSQLSLAWENAFRPLLFQVSAGFAGTVVLVGSMLMMLGMFAVPDAVLANDEPLGAMTQPHFLYTVGPRTMLSGLESPVIVQARIDEQGRVYDYTILSGPQDQATRTELDNELILSVYQPATVFGAPVRSTVLVAFSGISIHG